MSGHMQRPVCYRDLKTSTQNYIHRVWQETWDQQILNKLHNIHPSTSHWAALPMRRHDVRLTRLRIGHTRFTHRHLLLVRLHPPWSPTRGEAARRSSDMRQARHLPQRWYWSIVVQVRDVIRQFTQGTPNCNTNPNATVFGIPKEPVLESAELITSRLTGAGSLPASRLRRSMGQRARNKNPRLHFPRYGSPHTANMRVRLKTSLNNT
ncbi:RNA-directed DNA polymerase from mobile element jockey [Trichonephila clavipes]|nr:RNA-directed DNA polymerase from mobile element jockey [Trichonephila clavipes]